MSNQIDATAQSTEGINSDQLEYPKIRALNEPSHRASGGLSVVIQAPGSTDPNTKFFHECVIERTAAA
jgi:hypothetical protein